MYLPLKKRELTPKTLLYKPTAIVVGQTGSGKTSLANKLCKTSHKAGAGKGSLTQNLFRNDVCVGMNPFSLIDTPGTDSSTDTYKHAFLLREGLTTTDLNTIFVIIKFEHRFEKLIEIFYAQPVHYFTKKIIVMISHLDHSKNAVKDFREICQLFEKDCPDVSNIYFFSEQSPPEMVADFMFSCISNMTADKIEISDDDFQLNFNTFNTFQWTFKMKREYDLYKNKAKKLASDYTSFVCNNVLNMDDKDEILHMMLVQFRIDLDQMYEKFVNEYGDTMAQMDWYVFSIKMRKENIKLCDYFSEKVIPLMSYNLFDNKDPRNLIKQCPHCLLIWYKSEGCDGQTTCGNRGFTVNLGAPIRGLFKYVVNYIEGKISIEKNPNETPTPAPSQPISNVPAAAYKGCNATIVWSELPKLDDELILSLYKVKTMDEVKEIIKAESFIKVKENFEHGIDKRFHE